MEKSIENYNIYETALIEIDVMDKFLIFLNNNNSIRHLDLCINFDDLVI